MKGSYIFLADGFEETEALAPTDILRRGGIDAKLVSIYTDRKTVVSAHNIPITADLDFTEFLSGMQLEGTAEDDLMLFPGGMPGATNLAANRKLMALLFAHYTAGGLVAAICASPSIVLGLLPDLAGRKMTCYEGFQDNLIVKGVKFRRDDVVTDGNLVTGRGPGLSIAFGLGVLAALRGKDAADAVARGMML